MQVPNNDFEVKASQTLFGVVSCVSQFISPYKACIIISILFCNLGIFEEIIPHFHVKPI